MDSKKIFQTDILDIIFDQRNKVYGAYELRKNYHRRASHAVMWALSFVLIAISAPLIAGLIDVGPPSIKPRFSDTITFKTFVDPIIPPRPQKTNPPITHSGRNNIPTVIEIARDHEIEPPVLDPHPTLPGPQGPEGPNRNDPVLDPGNGGGSHTSVVIVEPVKDPNEIIPMETVEQQPEFPGGEEALMAYLSQHIHYPEKAIKNDIQGRIVVGFIVNKEGEIEEIKLLKSLGYGCDDEALRVISGMPKWKPGKNNGKAVKVYFNLPIVFEMNP